MGTSVEDSSLDILKPQNFCIFEDLLNLQFIRPTIFKTYNAIQTALHLLNPRHPNLLHMWTSQAGDGQHYCRNSDRKGASDSLRGGDLQLLFVAKVNFPPECNALSSTAVLASILLRTLVYFCLQY